MKTDWIILCKIFVLAVIKAPLLLSSLVHSTLMIFYYLEGLSYGTNLEVSHGTVLC